MEEHAILCISVSCKLKVKVKNCRKDVSSVRAESSVLNF